ncbi:MAG: hypothetical protein NZ937_02665 [Armatimonadetes bacterium]|nr:hypothetical protein [Armatimonadota bacterium]
MVDESQTHFKSTKENYQTFSFNLAVVHCDKGNLDSHPSACLSPVSKGIRFLVTQQPEFLMR